MELIRITTNDKNEQVVSARDLHNLLEIKKDFSDWIKTYISNDIYGFEKNLDYTTFEGNSTKSTPRPRIEYLLTTDMAKQLCMLSKVEKGREARKYFIACEKKLKESNIKKDLVYAIYEGGNEAIEAHKQLLEIEVKEATVPLIEDIKELRMGQFKSVSMTEIVRGLNIEGLTTTLLHEWFEAKGLGRYETRNKAKVRKFYHNDSFTRFIVDVGYARTRRSLDGNQEFIDYN
ncbi:MAG: antA/AntB antirepressor family protein, partial [Paraclostridium sp.]